MRIALILLCGLFGFAVQSASAAVSYTFRGEFESSHLLRSLEARQLSASIPSFPHRSLPQYANVRFIISKNKDDLEFGDANNAACKSAGFSTPVVTCTADGKSPGTLCPFDGGLTNECCDPAYKYDKTECGYPLTASSDTCGGKYKCICDRSLYPQGPDNKCVAPQEYDTSDTCTEGGTKYYGRCKCPENYIEGCTGPNQEGKGAACEISGDKNYAACQCKAGYNLTCADFGPVTPSDYCELKGIKYYKQCKDCSLPDGYYASCSANQTKTGSMEVCGKTFYACRNVALGDVFYSDHTYTTADNLEITDKKKPIGIVFKADNGFNRVIALTEKKQVFATDWEEQPLSKSPKGFAGKGFDSGKNYSTHYIKSEWAENGKDNTKGIMQHGVDFDYYPQAAGYAYSYKTAGTCSGDWYLPSVNEIYKNIYNDKGTKDNVNKINDALGKVNAAGIPATKLFASGSKLWASVPCWMQTTLSSIHVYNFSNATATYSVNNANWKDSLPVRPAMYTNSICANNVVYKPSCATTATYTEKSCPNGATGSLTDDDGNTCYVCVKTGDILFSDRSFGTKLDENKTPIGVILDPGKKTAVALELLDKMIWSNDTYDTSVPNGYNSLSYADGEVYTQGLVDLAATRKKNYNAAQAAFNYEPAACSGSWCGKGKWYLGSYYEYNPLLTGKGGSNRCPVPGETSAYYQCGDVAYTLYNLFNYNIYEVIDTFGTVIWTSNESSASSAYDFMVGGTSSTYSSSKSANFNVWPMIHYGEGGSCGGDLVYDRDISKDNDGYTCLSCKNPAGETKYICECTDGSIEGALRTQGYEAKNPVDRCPVKGVCSPKMCNNKFYLQGCLGLSGSISTTYNSGDRIYCDTTQTCNLIDYRSDAQTKVNGDFSLGGDSDFGGDTITGGTTITIIQPCNQCALVGYFGARPSYTTGKAVCEEETINGVTCYKRCCPEGYIFNAKDKKCYSCTNGTYNSATNKCDCNPGYSPSDKVENICCRDGYVHDPEGKDGDKCYRCDNSNFYYSTDYHMCLQIANNCPSNSIFCSAASSGRGCYSQTGYTKTSASNNACVGTYDANGPSGAGCYSCLNTSDKTGTYDTACHNCLADKVFEP